MCTWITYRELKNGIPVLTEDGEVVGTSKQAAKRGIAQVVFSRIVMAVPGMCECVNCLFCHVVHHHDSVRIVSVCILCHLVHHPVCVMNVSVCLLCHMIYHHDNVRNV